MVAKPKHIDGRIWNDEKFHHLSPTEKLLALYGLTSQANRIGLFKFSLALAAEDTGLPIDAVREGVRGLYPGLGWQYDEARRVLYIPTWWKYNQPSTENVLKGMLEDLHDLPESPLVTRFCRNVAYLPETLHTRFREECLRHKPTECEEEGEPERNGHAATADVPREAAVQREAEDPDEVVLSVRIPRADADVAARERVIRAWALNGPELLHFR